MKYAQHGSSFNNRNTLKKRRIFAIVSIIIGIGFVLFAAISIKHNLLNIKETDIEEGNLVIVDDIINEQDKIIEDNEQKINGEIELLTVGEIKGFGISRRGVSDNLFMHIIVADLPDIDIENQFYEGWLVKPGVTEFFSTGELFVRSDGQWGLVWEQDIDKAEYDLFDYSKVVVTLEQRDGNNAPSSIHILEGKF